ncbi:hypothetical protein TWF788_008230 [Orbilia oligospora]|nr:hypothetical protein TWF788_008230 [Orbilia oligospora]
MLSPLFFPEPNAPVESESPCPDPPQSPHSDGNQSPSGFEGLAGSPIIGQPGATTTRVIVESYTTPPIHEVLSPLLRSEPNTPIKSESPCPDISQSPRTDADQSPSGSESPPRSTVTRLPRATTPHPARITKPLHYQSRLPSLQMTQSSFESLATAKTVPSFNKKAVVTNARRKNFKAAGIIGHRLRSEKLEYCVTWEPSWVTKKIYESKVRMVDSNGNPTSEGSAKEEWCSWNAVGVLDTYSKGEYHAYHVEWLPQWLGVSNIGDGLLYNYMEQLAA